MSRAVARSRLNGDDKTFIFKQSSPAGRFTIFEMDDIDLKKFIRELRETKLALQQEKVAYENELQQLEGHQKSLRQVYNVVDAIDQLKYSERGQSDSDFVPERYNN